MNTASNKKPRSLKLQQPLTALPPSRKQPVAPPAYRPQPTPKVLQKKMVGGARPATGQAPRQPVAPPVYRPQPLPKVLQRKSSDKPQSSGAIHSGRSPVAPPVYRPNATPRVLSKAINRGSGQTASPIRSSANQAARTNHSVVLQRQTAPGMFVSHQRNVNSARPPERLSGPRLMGSQCIQRMMVSGPRSVSDDKGHTIHFEGTLDSEQRTEIFSYVSRIERAQAINKILRGEQSDREGLKAKGNLIAGSIRYSGQITNEPLTLYRKVQSLHDRDREGPKKQDTIISTTDDASITRLWGGAYTYTITVPRGERYIRVEHEVLNEHGQKVPFNEFLLGPGFFVYNHGGDDHVTYTAVRSKADEIWSSYVKRLEQSRQRSAVEIQERTLFLDVTPSNKASLASSERRGILIDPNPPQLDWNARLTREQLDSVKDKPMRQWFRLLDG